MANQVAHSNADTIAELQQLVAAAVSNLQNVDRYEFGSQRTSADQIEHAVRNLLLDSDSRFAKPVGVRAPGDLLFRGTKLCHINIKTTDLDKTFHMPNLISADNLWKIFSNDQLFFLLRVTHRSGTIAGTDFHDIRSIDWSNLQIGALGTGQLQIRNGLKPLTASSCSADEWMTQWRTIMLDFYDREAVKISKRLNKWKAR